MKLDEVHPARGSGHQHACECRAPYRIRTLNRVTHACRKLEKKSPAKEPVPAHAKLLVSREEAGQLLSSSVRGIDYLLATRRLPFWRIGGRVLISVADLRKYARGDHPERIVA
jgi:excisionase family DNA binding protein